MTPTTNEIRNIDIASDLDNITIDLEELVALLQLYDEHREEELAGVDPNKPHTAAVLVARQGLGLALLRAIEDKAIRLQKLASATMQRAYELARRSKSTATEKEADQFPTP